MPIIKQSNQTVSPRNDKQKNNQTLNTIQLLESSYPVQSDCPNSKSSQHSASRYNSSDNVLKPTVTLSQPTIEKYQLSSTTIQSCSKMSI